MGTNRRPAVRGPAVRGAAARAAANRPPVGAVLLSQADLVLDWLAELPPGGWATPSILPGWAVAELAEHVGAVLRSVAGTLARSSAAGSSAARPGTIADYLAGYPSAAGRIQDREVAAATGRAGSEILARLRAERAAAEAAIGADPSAGEDVVVGSHGPIRAADFLVTRVIEVVVHADDLSRSVPDRPAVPLEPAALRITARALAEVLAARAPGRSVEVRIPPYAAVQCVAGPRHTRGTPPNVVEADPVSWVRLAAGRLAWADGVSTGAVAASGDRSDISALLPLL